MSGGGVIMEEKDIGVRSDAAWGDVFLMDWY